MTTHLRIDAHVHYTPPALAANLAEFAAREPYWGLLLNSPHSIQGWATAERMLADMAAAALDKVVLVGEYFQRHDSCVARNDQAIALTRRYPQQILAMATIQPQAGQAALDELKRCADNGLVGVGELNPYAQGYRLTDPDFLRLAEACIELDIPLNLHGSEPIGGYYLGKSTTPLRDYYDLACRYPELKLILAHWGGGLFFYEIMPRVRRQLRQVWYDTAASPLLYPTAQIFNLALSAIDHRKILYGSDYPLRIYPRQQSEPDFHRFLHAIDQLNLSPTVHDDILGNNAARLFGLLNARPPSVERAETDFDRLSPPHPYNEAPAPALRPLAPVSLPITGAMAVSFVAQQWPETQPIFEQFNLAWQDTPLPTWEPIAQAAAVQGHPPEMQQRLLAALNEIIND